MYAEVKYSSLFAKKDEFINLIWPMVILFILIIFSISGGVLNSSDKNFYHYISGVLFLNIVHNVFSFFLVFFLPEMKQMVNEINEKKIIKLQYQWILVFLFIGLYFFNIGKFSGLRIFEMDAVFLVSLVLAIISTHYHTIKQVYGLSIAYNFKIIKNDKLLMAEREAIQTSGKHEKWLFNFLLLISSVGFIERAIFGGKMKYLLFSVSAITFLLILANSYKVFKIKKTNKIFFLLRLIFLPLGVLNPLFQLGVPSYHGVEYFFTCKKMFNVSKIGSALVKKILWRYIVPISIVVGLISTAKVQRGYGELLHMWMPEYKVFFQAIGVISISLTFTHFYVDGQIFRFSKNLKSKKYMDLIIK